MFVDTSGAFWLSDPVLVIALLAGAVALMVWCHRWSEAGVMPLPGRMSAKSPRAGRGDRALRQRIDARPSALAERRTLRTRRTRPQQAA